MPITRNFIFEEDDDTGVLGLRPTWLKVANPTTAVAHDMLEHFPPNDLDAVEDEFLALGALFALRIENGSFSRHDTAAGQLANVVFGVLVDCRREDRDFPSYFKTNRLPDEFQWAENTIQLAVPRALEMARRELQAIYDSGEYDDEDEVERSLLGDEALLAKTLISFLRTGYRKTYRRYQNADLYSVSNDLFKEVDKVSKFLSECEYLAEGDEVQISVDLRRHAVRFKVNGLTQDQLGL